MATNNTAEAEEAIDMDAEWQATGHRKNIPREGRTMQRKLCRTVHSCCIEQVNNKAWNSKQALLSEVPKQKPLRFF